ncbi:MAG: helix-turn-helix domain-containing protein [Firmicutes bacterium]|nr:helix-turn-helix domain-containing protein [Bacillota bacterium]
MISYEPLFLTMKKKGITTYKLFKMGFSKSTYYAMKDRKSVLASTIDQLCTLLECEVSDVVKFVPEQD